MRTTLLILLSLLFSASYAQNDAKLNIYLSLTVNQADSLIQANSSNPNFIILDVRTPTECTNTGIIANAININFYDTNFNSLINALDHNKMYLVYCGSGGRSAQTMTKMQNFNFVEVYNMLGGMSAWLTAGKPTVPFYVGIDVVKSYPKFPLTYPNPVSHSFSVTILPSYRGTLSLIDMTGRIVFSKPAVAGDQYIDVSSYKSGLYFIRLDAGSRSYTGKLILK